MPTLSIKLIDALPPEQAREIKLYGEFLKIWEAKQAIRAAHQAQIAAAKELLKDDSFTPMAVHNHD